MRILPILFILSMILIFNSCSFHRKAYKKQYEIIDYLLYPVVDSALTWFLSGFDKSIIENKLSITIDTRPPIGDYYYKISLDIQEFETKGKIRKSDVNEMRKYLLLRSNRKVILNRGQFIIPVIFSTDYNFAGYGKTEYPLSTFTDGHLITICMKEWHIIKVYYYGVDVSEEFFEKFKFRPPESCVPGY